MNKQLSYLYNRFKNELGFFLSISLGIFLFILFFQPFPLAIKDFDNGLVLLAGFGGIIFLFLLIVDIIIPLLAEGRYSLSNEARDLSFIGGVAIFVLSSVAFAFYLRYVGKVFMTFHIMFKVLLICLVPPIVLRLFYLRKQSILLNKSLRDENQTLKKRLETIEIKSLNKTVKFFTDNNKESIEIQLVDLILIKSADNYVEVFHKEDDQIKKKLLRSTLKNIELQLSLYSGFMRCHRTYIVNVHFIEKLSSQLSNYRISIRGIEERLPVSRQYILKLKETIREA